MIVADTSVWVQFFRGKERRTAEHLRELLDRDEVSLVAPVRVEILAGTSRPDFVRLQPLLSALPLLFPTEDTWREMERWIAVAIAAGERFGIGDLLIGAI
ncbi:MAG: PIN domain-containing protein, partial [Chloroflexota bacterium]